MTRPVSRSIRRRRALLGRVSVFVLLLLGGAHAGSFAHEMAVRHVVCEEHGERVEVADRPTQRVTSDAIAAAEDAPGTDAAHEHEHCAVGSTVHAASGVSEADQSTVIAVTRGEHRPQDGPYLGGIPVFRLAPKNSPPSAGA